MPWKYTEEYYREYTRTTWDAAARPYLGLMERFRPFREALVDALDPRPGEAVLDLGTGPGEPALTIARRVGPGGRALGVDLSEQMVELARRRARDGGVGNAEFRAMDCGTLDLPEAGFDAVVSSFGFQIFTDPERAAREARRVVRPGGRIAVSVWPPGERVPFLDVLVAPMLARVEPDETGYVPTPYEVGGPGEMVRFLGEAGFHGGIERSVRHTFRFAGPDEYLDILLNGTPLGHSLSEEDPPVQKEILREVRERLARYERGGGIELPAECVLVTARA